MKHAEKIVNFHRTVFLKLNFEFIQKKRFSGFCQKFLQTMDEVDTKKDWSFIIIKYSLPESDFIHPCTVNYELKFGPSPLIIRCGQETNLAGIFKIFILNLTRNNKKLSQNCIEIFLLVVLW
jgi:hypothetical protein